MTTEAIKVQYAQKVQEEKSLSWLQKYVLMRAHPRRICFDMAGLPWFVYLMWQHQWQQALIVIFCFAGLGLLATYNADVESMGETILGKMALLHLHPVNITVQLISLFPMIYGIWQHSVELILIGNSMIFLGHFFGWEKIHPAFADKNVKRE